MWIIVVCCELLISAVIRLFSYSFLYSVSAIFPSSLFTKRKCNSHSSFFILHSSFFILHSSFKKSPSVGRVTARYFPCFLLFPLTHINEKTNNVYFSKKISPKVLVVRKKAVPLHSLSGKRYC